MSVNPIGLTLTQWADAVIITVDDAWLFGKLESEERWRDWAVGFTRAPSFANKLVPDPYQFSNWRDWAERVYPMLEGA